MVPVLPEQLMFTAAAAVLSLLLYLRSRAAPAPLSTSGGDFSLESILRARGSNSFDFFPSHAQGDTGPQVHLVAHKLKSLGFDPWFDKWDGRGSIDVTKPGMIRGVQTSGAMVIVLSKTFFQRPFCRLELVTALKARRPIICIHESDVRLGAFDFAAATKGAPAAFHPIINQITSDVNCMPLRRDEQSEPSDVCANVQEDRPPLSLVAVLI